ncbi:MAG: 7-cyano-7-deazaguanine synthase [Candidatus Nanoarchaeia archaeon]|nr:7-cyano-7-deazaguanine synthase [Candidatus Nanoarchaeia archaeon]
MNDYEKILIKKRNFVTKEPNNKKGVIIISGGMDSAVLTLMLLKKGYKLYPLFIRRGQRNLKFEEKSVDYFSNYFKKRYKNYNMPKKVSVNIPLNDFKDNLIKYMKKKGHPLRDPMMQSIAVQYAISLNKNVKTIFTGTNKEDPFPHCTYNSILASMISIIENTNDWSWQIICPFIDKSFNLNWGKKDIIKYAEKLNFPIERTRSCYTNNKIHCGICLTCLRRKSAFKQTNLIDKTQYLN